MSQLRRAIAALVCAGLSACSEAWNIPGNPVDMNGTKAYMAERRDMPTHVDYDAAEADRVNTGRCSHTPVAAAGNVAPVSDEATPLSPGDLVVLALPGNDPPSGTYKVDSSGVLSLDLLGSLRVKGRTIKQVETELAQQLVATGYFRAGHARPMLRLLDRGAVHVQVAGAVFQSGRVVINGKSGSDRDVLHDSATGDYGPGRVLSNALASASGVRPDADVEHITVIRDGQRSVVNLTGLLTGEPVDDPLLVEGDRVEVPSLGCFQEALARPSLITPPGVRAYLSNLTIPAAGNALAAVGRDATTFPYGTRLLQALTSGNCIGGVQSTNADRWAVLISVNPMTNRSEVIERRIEALIRRGDRDGYNPVLMPGDAMACYDSAVTNVRDWIRAIGEGLNLKAL